MAGGEAARKRPALMRVKVLGKNYVYPVKDYSEEIGSFCDRVLKKKFKGNIPGEYDIVIGGEVYDDSIVLDIVWEAVVDSGHVEVLFLGHVDASMDSLSTMAVGESARSTSMRKRPVQMRIRLLGKNYIYPVKDHSEEIGSFCDRVLKKKFKGNIPAEYDTVIGGDVYHEGMVLDDVWEAVLDAGHMEIEFLGHVDASMGSLNMSSLLRGATNISGTNSNIQSMNPPGQPLRRNRDVGSTAKPKQDATDAKDAVSDLVQVLFKEVKEARTSESWEKCYCYLRLAQKGGIVASLKELDELFSDIFSSLVDSSPSQLTDTQRSALSVLTEASMDGNYAEAQNWLGECYECGHGVCVDEKRAAELYSMAASQGNFDGQRRMGCMYLQGRGVPKDTAMAESWLSKAAKGGHWGAKDMLTKMRASYTDPVEFNWAITNWKEVSERNEYMFSNPVIFSSPFSAHRAQWKLQLYPKGRYNNSAHISVFLVLHNPQSLPSNWWAGTKLVHFTLTVVNQKDKSQSRVFEGYFDFFHELGYPWHTPLSMLQSESDGFVVGNRLEVKAMVRMVK